MSLDSNDDETARRNQEALERYTQDFAARKRAEETSKPADASGTSHTSATRDIPSGGLVGAVSDTFTSGARRVKDFFRASYEVTAHKLRWIGPVARPFVVVAKWTAPKLYHAACWTLPRMFSKKDKTRPGHRRFSSIRSAFSIVAMGVCLALSPHYLPYVYYHATESTYQIYVPNAGVFHNQQFNNPNQSGHVIAPRDEISTVFPKYINEKGQLEQTRFDIDSNGYFLFFRPDLAAAQLTPQSPYGAECTVMQQLLSPSCQQDLTA